MRKIIFRAKRIKTGAWVYGDLVQRRERDCYIWSKERGKMVSCKVDPKTVGQLKNEKGATHAIGNPEVLDDNGYNIEGVCVMDFSGLRDMYNTSECFHSRSVNC